MNNQIMKSRNKGLFLTLLKEINEQDLKFIVRIKFNNNLKIYGRIVQKDWREVYNLK